jgi:3-phosphoshikimate 1-carboxyvinyltransferase
MAGLTRGEVALLEPADCDDSDYMVDGLRTLGVAVEKEPGRLVVHGQPFTAPAKPLFLGNSGTAVRFLAAACASLDGSVVVDGVERMRQRPIRDLVEALRAWGVSVETATDCPPVTIRSTGRFGGTTTVKGSASSQYLTGLLLVAPLAERDVRIVIEGELVSKPYVDLTLAMMAERGITAANHDYASFEIPGNQSYAPGSYRIEADASGATYFLAAPAIAGGRVRVEHLSFTSEQGDAQFARVLEQMGCTVRAGANYIEVEHAGVLRGVDVDLNAMPDTAQTLAVSALFAEGPTTIRNVANMRIKETDRITATATELRKLGAEVEEFPDGLRITPGTLRAAVIDTYDDHRMAMAFAMAGLRIPGVVINDPGCVSKTFPDFFERWAAL